MEFRETWDQLVSAARQKSVSVTQDSDHTSRMTIASAGSAGSGGGSADLKFSQAPWMSASRVASQLQASTGAAVTKLNAAHEGVTWGLEGFLTPAVLDEVRTTWVERLEAAKTECQRLEGALIATGKSLGEADSRVAQSLGQQHSRGDSKTGR
ncbi:hypothetical protein AABB02_27840 [Streptomyces rimosus]|uniref:hypothetical protein n=1 Tax=Streptomyces rimosus TaxID=1927 RepID=UPI0031D14343